MAQGIFITGLSWKVGKTFAAAGIAANLINKGLSVGVCKPITTDCLKCSGKPYSIQGEMLKLAAGSNDLPEIAYPFCLRNKGLIPELLINEGESFSLEPIKNAYNSLIEKNDYVIVVGTGGVAEPVDSKLDMTDVASTINLPIVFVLNPGIDNLQLIKIAAQYVISKNLTIAGYIINEKFMNTYNEKEAAQAKLIEEFLGIKFLGWLPFSDDVNPVYGELGKLVENASFNIQIDELLKWGE